MAFQRDPEYPFRPLNGPWKDRIAFASGLPLAYRPNELLTRGRDNAGQASEYLRRLRREVEVRTIHEGFFLLEADERFDVPAAVLALRELGVQVEANVVFFNHCGCGGCGGCACCCGGHGGGVGGNPFNSNPFNSNPFNSNPFNSNPFNSNPFNSNPFNSNWAATGIRPSSARPANEPRVLGHAHGRAKAIVFDTGIAHFDKLPALVQTQSHKDADAADREEPDLEPQPSGDKFLDPSSGHGTFIAGIIEQLAPGHTVSCARVLGNFGDGDAASIAHGIWQRLPQLDGNTILNMSFGSYGDPELLVLSEAIRDAQNEGAVVVSSAGNDATCFRSYPAALPDVVSVGSIDGGGRARYSNFGDWVRACAPGTDVVSSFFADFDGAATPAPGADDPDLFKGWAQWSGTSFAAPIVVAALMRHMATRSVAAADAVSALIDNPSLGRYPGLGTVVNLVPGL